MYILQRSNAMLQRSSLCGTDHATAGQAGPALPGAPIHTDHQAEHSKQLPPNSRKATKLCPDTSSSNRGSLTNIFDHACGQMRVEPGQKSL